MARMMDGLFRCEFNRPLRSNMVKRAIFRLLFGVSMLAYHVAYAWADSLPAASATEAQDSSQLTALTDPNLVSEVYEGQDHLVCDQNTLKIPPWFFTSPNTTSPPAENAPFLTANKAHCERGNYTVYLGIGSNCDGANYCLQASFSVYRSPPDSVSALIYKVLDAQTRKIQLHRNIDAFYVPSTCAAYCNEEQLTWFSGEQIFILGTKSYGGEEAIEALARSANSYIDQQE